MCSGCSEKPITYAYRTLSSAKQNYAQLEKEAFSLPYGIQKFYQYLYGRSFVLVTDHKPLTHLLGPKKAIPPLAAARLQRWALLLSSYHYTIEYKSTRQHANADGLSRLPVGGRDIELSGVAESFMVDQIQALPVTVDQLQMVTRQDPILSRVHRYVREGWLSEKEVELTPFENRRCQLSTQGDCLLRGNCVVVPQGLRARMHSRRAPQYPTGCYPDEGHCKIIFLVAWPG